MWELIRQNQRKTWTLVLGMGSFLLLVGAVLGYALLDDPFSGLGIAAIVWIIQSLVSYFAGDQIFLTMSGAVPASEADFAVLHNVVEEMQIASGLPCKPAVYVIAEDAPNAFAVGRSPERASVAVTTALLDMLDRDELQGVIAHELAHIKNRDALYMMMVGVMLGTIVLISDMGMRQLFYGGRRRSDREDRQTSQIDLLMMLLAVVLIIIAPLVAQLIYYAVSRSREYLADACAAQFTRYPEGLAGALEKLAQNSNKFEAATKAMAPLYIVNPLQFSGRSLADLTATHPPISERIRILRSIGKNQAGMLAQASEEETYRAYEAAYQQVTHKNKGLLPSRVLQAG